MIARWPLAAVFFIGFVSACLALASNANAQAPASDYPTRAVKIIVPFPAGGSADVIPRIVAEKLSAKWGQPIIVENRPGAAGNIGAEAVYKAESDGHTLLSSPPSPLTINPSLYQKLAHDPAQFVPVTVIAAIPNVLLVHPNAGAKSVAELIAAAKAAPDRFNYASQGSGTTSHLTAEMFKTMAGVKLTHVPYKGTAPALADLLAGQVEIMFDNLGVSLPHVKSGKLKALAVCGERRIASLPGVPAMSEILPGFAAITWFGVVAPPKTPLAIAEKFSAAVADAIRMPDTLKKFTDLSADPVGNTPAEMAAFLKQDTERWRAVIRSANVKMD